MPKDINAYRELVQEPWGRIFYDLAYKQLGIPESPRLKILDFGSGFGVCADYYAKWHDVTAIEPNTEMLAQRLITNSYEQIKGDIAALRHFKGEFDIVICHNVLEYARNKEEIFEALAGAVKPGGLLSVVKHNLYGRIMAAAVFDNDPEKAMNLYNDIDSDKSSTFGDRYLYSNENLLAWADKHNLAAKAHYGMRAFYALGQNNDAKHCDNWYEKMLALEYKLGSVDEFRQVAYFNHFIFSGTIQST